ncbi:MAG: GNAT family N-acetyltransferase [Pseudomonadota bacterium]
MTPEHLARAHSGAFADARPWSAAEFRDLLASSAVFQVGDATCFALVRVVVDEAELLTIATAPIARRQGRAAAIMEDWQAEAARRGARNAFLEVSEDNRAACALYIACGYAVTGRRPGYYRRSDATRSDALLMARALSPSDAPSTGHEATKSG